MLSNIAVLRTVKENANKAVLDALPSILFDGSHNGKDAQKYYLQGPAAEYVPVDIPDETAKKLSKCATALAMQLMFENDMSSGRALTLRKLIVVEHTKPMGNVPRDTIENALTATLKIPDDCPTSYNDYIVTFHRNLLPKEVKVTEYGIDGSSKVML